MSATVGKVQRPPVAPSGSTVKYIDPPLDWRDVLANDALGPDATRQKASYLAKQASRRWLGEVQRATLNMGTTEARRLLAGKSPWSTGRE